MFENAEDRRSSLFSGFRFMKSENNALSRPHGQAVKTPPFHGGNTGSNPVGVRGNSMSSRHFLTESATDAPLKLCCEHLRSKCSKTQRIEDPRYFPVFVL